MAALIDVYNPAMWAQETLLQLFPALRMAGLVYREFENVVQEQGDTVNTRLPAKLAAATVNPASFSSTAPTATNVQVKLDQWKHVTFEIGDKEASLSMKDLVAEFMGPAAEALTESIEDAMMALYKDVYNFTGAAASTPDDVAELGTDIKQKFDELNVPDAGRNVVLGPAAANEFNQVFYMDYVSGSPEQQATGALRPKFGMNYVGSTKLPTHTAGGLEAGTVTGIQAIDSTSLVCASMGISKAYKTGDLITIATGPAAGQYVLTADGTTAVGETVTLPISPGLRGTTAGGEVVTPIASHAVNLAFHRQAFALVSRPLKVPAAPGANVYVAVYNGIGLRSAVWYEPKDYRTYVRLDSLFGVKTLDARKAIRVLG